ncbi:gfo/Idh/MocA family oxidoreductase [Bacillus subtilis]|nr:Gfo/Idh/MocA family oxidoreductase [Bacillus subtilis]QGH95617.1 gfo/Idh/MocA family oxidoreductase [Bacillus subtilis]QGI20756.1 gfo/Idh/MocA family oxidoreductase [Bacillus subtilis]
MHRLQKSILNKLGDNIMKIGIIGLGVISKYYVEAIKQLDSFTLSAVCDIQKEKMSPFPEAEHYTDYRTFLEKADIDGVVINVPNHMHYDICRYALECGHHICCEKPLTIELKDADRLAERSQQVQKTLFTAFHRRYNINFLNEMKKINLSQIKSVKARYLENIKEHAGSDSWYLEPDQCGGGCVADNGPNVFDTLSYFLGKLDVTGAQIWNNANDIDVQAVIQLKNGDGVQAQVELDWEFPHGERKDVDITLQDGTTIHIDMLKDFEVFKSSLYHEYEEILKDFKASIAAGNCFGESGQDAVRLVQEAYSFGRVTL